MSDYFAAIFGAGICGTALAQRLADKGQKVLLVDPYVSENAPGAPAGLVNPATGRRAKLCWRGRQCYDALTEQVKRLEEMNGGNLASYTGVIRPAINEKLAENFKAALDKYDWPEGWVRWLESDEIEALNPHIASNFGGLAVDCGFTVYVDRYLNAYRKFLREQGVDCRYEKAHYRYDDAAATFRIQFEDSTGVSADQVVVAVGYRTPDFGEWTYLPLEGVKGQIVIYEADSDLDWEHAVSAKGYSMRRGERELIVGATYEHHFDGLDTTEEAFKCIERKVPLMFSDMAGRLQKKGQLAGVRVTTPNRLPVAGRHPANPNLCIYTGMNSKGLLFSHYVGGLLAGHLVDGQPLPGEVDVKRFAYKDD